MFGVHRNELCYKQYMYIRDNFTKELIGNSNTPRI